jgi:phosphoglycolate phosphatase-like HAD superfamily hydrolase
MRIVCFDIDGTLIRTDGAGRRAIQRALVDVLGTAGPIDELRFDGRTDGDIVLRLAEGAGIEITGERMNDVLARYELLLDEELRRPGHVTTVFPGVLEALDALEQRPFDAVLGLVTGNIQGGARLKLQSAGIAFDRFPVGGFGSDHHVRAELPEFARARAESHLGRDVAGSDLVIIGDTPADMTCGNSIGARAIGVATAAYTVDELMAAGACVAFPDLSDTGALLQMIFT